MTRLQYGFGIGVGLVALAIPILLFATPHARVEKGDRVGRRASPHVMRVIPLERPDVPAPDPASAVSQNKTVENTAPPVEAEPPPFNEKDLLEPGQTTSAIEHHHRRAEHGDICSRHGGHRVEFHRGHRLLWRCVYPRGH